MEPTVKVYVFLWPTKDEKRFVLLYVRQVGKEFTGIIHPYYTKPIPNSERLSCIQEHVSMGLVQFQTSTCPGLAMLLPKDSTRLEKEQAYREVCRFMDQPRTGLILVEV